MSAEMAAPLDEPTADLTQLVHRRLPTVSQHYTARDCMLYALGLGVGSDPCDPAQLRYVQGEQLQVLPALAAVLASPTEWMRDVALGIRWERLVALSHSLEILHPLPSEATVRSQARVTAVHDRGPGRGAVIHWERSLHNAADDRCLAVLHARALARDNGGFGGPAPAPRKEEVPPAGLPTCRHRWTTLQMQGLIYRLSGDLNPLHSDPGVAQAAGFERPILHGLCSLGICAYLVTTHLCDGDSTALRAISARYAGVVYPGETLEVDFWVHGPEVQFECRVAGRDSVVLSGGQAHCVL